MREIKNAKITGTFLGVEDHGIATFYINLNYGGGGQSAGTYAIDQPIKDANGKFVCRQGTAKGLQAILTILKVLEVDSWEKLIGENIRVDSDMDGVYRIGHLLKDNWFDFKEHFAE
jgi:hypothetical protein